MVSLNGKWVTTAGPRGYAIHYWDANCEWRPNPDFARVFDSYKEAQEAFPRNILCGDCRKNPMVAFLASR